MKERKKGSTSITEYFYLLERTAGTAKTGVAEENLYLSYTRSRESTIASVCATLSSSAASYSSYGAFEVDATNAPGLYRVDIPNTAFSLNANVDSVILTLRATTTSSVAPAMKEVLLVDNTSSDNYSLIGAGVKAVTVVGNVGGSVGSVVGNVGGSVGSVAGGVTGSVGSVVGNVGGSVGSVSATVTVGAVAVASVSAAALADFFDTDSGTTYASAVAGSVVKEIADNAGGSALTAAAIADAVWDESATAHTSAGTFGVQCGTDIDAILVDTAEIGAAGAGLTAIPKVGSVTGNVGGSVGSVVGNVGGSVGSVVGGVGATVTVGTVASVSGNVGGSVGSVVGNVGGSVASVVGGVGGSVGSVSGGVTGSVGSVVGGVGATVTAAVSSNADKTGYALSATGSAALTEDYPTDGSTGTLNQVLYAIMQGLSDFSITASTRTVLKLDGTTTAMQYSFNSDTSPTAQVRFA